MDKRIAIVTGASSGLGAEFVKQLDEHEKLDEIWVIARRRERMAALQEEVHTPLRVFAWDLTEPETFSGFSELLASEKPHIMFLVNAAGYGKIGSFRDISPEENERMVDLNRRAAMSVTQRSIPYMEKAAASWKYAQPPLFSRCSIWIPTRQQRPFCIAIPGLFGLSFWGRESM